MTVGTAFPLFADRGKKLFLIYICEHALRKFEWRRRRRPCTFANIFFSSSDLGAAERVLSTFFRIRPNKIGKVAQFAFALVMGGRGEK